jgi:hypothetical protein
MKQPYVSFPIKILKKRLPRKTNSVFYAGKDIAEIKINTKLFILTTAGYYEFQYQDRSGKTQKGNESSPIIKTWTDKKIKIISDNDWISNWGWFTIEVWEQDDNKSTMIKVPDTAYTTYDEAMEAFTKFIKESLINGL